MTIRNGDQSLPSTARQLPGWLAAVRVAFTACVAALAAGLACQANAPDSGSVAEASIRIDASKRLNPISDLLYGQFAEFMFENIKQGLWAELLVNRGFEVPAEPPAASHYWERYPDTRNHPNGFLMGGDRHGIPEQGYPEHIENRAQVLTNLLPGQLGHGIFQARIPLRAGITYEGTVWLRGTGARRGLDGIETSGSFDGRISVSLEEDVSGGEVYSSVDLTGIPESWTRFGFELPAVRNDAGARLAIRMFGVGTLWIDQVSLMPSDAIDNLRADVMERIRRLQPAFIRWPGGNVAQDYHWEWGIGPSDQRPVWINMSWDDDPEPSEFGTLEYLAFCRSVGAEPNIVVNLEGRGATMAEAAALRREGRDPRTHSRPATAAEAAAWVEYVNGSEESKYGALRARDGHPEPFGVKYWEIGNEIWGDWVRGHSDASTYAANARHYIQAMKAVDPSISIIAVGDEDPEWNRTVLEQIGDDIDLLAIHHYRPKDDDPPGYGALMARPLAYERLYDGVREMVREIVPDQDVGIALNEWNTTFGIPRQHTMESALYGARLMNVFERQGDIIRMSAVSDLVNGWPGGVIQAGRNGLFTTATFSVIEAYAAHRGDWRLSADVSCDLMHQTGDPELGDSVPALDVAASATADGRHIYVKVVNTSAESGIKATIELKGVEDGRATQASVATITAPSLETANSFARPDRIAAQASRVAVSGSELVWEFPKHSVTVIDLPIR